MSKSFTELTQMYLDALQGRPSYNNTVRCMRQWISTLTEVPTRQEVIARMKVKCAGHFQPGATQANEELKHLRALIRLGYYQEVYDGPNPTEGVKKWKTSKRKRILRHLEIRTVLRALESAETETERRDRALFGLMLFGGCRPGVARTVRRTHITPYGEMGCWSKPKTKNGETQDLPLPAQLMRWLAEAPTVAGSPYYFPGLDPKKPMHHTNVRKRWAPFAQAHRIPGFWTYDFRRTMSCYLANQFKASDSTIMAVLNHYDGRPIGHYVHVPFDALAPIVQAYADWLFTFTQEVDHVDLEQPTLPFPTLRHDRQPELVAQFAGMRAAQSPQYADGGRR